MIEVKTNQKEGTVNLSVEGNFRDITLDLVLILSSVTNAIEEDTDKEAADEMRKLVARYLIDVVKYGDPLREGSQEKISIDGNVLEFLKAYKQSRDEYDD